MKLRRRQASEEAVFESVCILAVLSLMGGTIGDSLGYQGAGFIVGLALGAVFLVWR